MTHALSLVQPGTVYLVGAGPGHPGLMTARAIQIMAEADVVVYDRLLSSRALGLASSTADFIYVGKASGRHTMHQTDISDLLVSLALEGKVVVRLKGGDPFVFGRGGEEAQACVAAGVPFEVIPGVTSAVSVSAFAGIPVTHRGIATSFSVIAGHQSVEGTEEDADWTGFAANGGTLVILMGVSQLDLIAHRLRKAGRSRETPVALIRWGTRAAQQTLVGTLDDIVEKARAAQFQSPAIIVVGEVVQLRETLSWFEGKPLMGCRILVAADTVSEGRRRAEALEALGAETLDISVEHGVMDAPLTLQHMLTQPEFGKWLVFPSIQSVHAFFRCIQRLQLDWRQLASYRFMAAGERVAQVLRDYRIQPDSVLPHAMLSNGSEEFRSGIQLDKIFHIHHQTPQLRAMFQAADRPFDFILATSGEAVQFVRQLAHNFTPFHRDYEVPVSMADSLDELVAWLREGRYRSEVVASG